MSQPAPAPDDTPRSADLSRAFLRGRGLLIVRSVWLLLASGLLANVILGIHVYYRAQETICTSDLAECSFLHSLRQTRYERSTSWGSRFRTCYLCHSRGGGSPAGLLERWGGDFLAQVS